MAEPMTWTQFLQLLNEWRIPYHAQAGWMHNTRTAEGRPWGPVHGILLHHTGDDAPDVADIRVLSQGRSDLTGPLCHWAMRDDGVVELIGWGRTNHAGRGSAGVLAAVQSEDYGAYPPAPGADVIDGNARFYGQETCYSGDAAPTSPAYRSTVRIFAAICTWHGWSAKSCIGHKEWTARKVDPGHVDMAKFRADVASAIAAGPQSEDDMPLNDTDKAWISDTIRQTIRDEIRTQAFAGPSEPDEQVRGRSLAGLALVAARASRAAQDEATHGRVLGQAAGTALGALATQVAAGRLSDQQATALTTELRQALPGAVLSALAELAKPKA